MAWAVAQSLPRRIRSSLRRFIGRQAQSLANQAKELGQVIAKGAETVERSAVNQMQATAETMRRRAEG